MRRSLHLCPGAVSYFPFPGSWPLLKAPHTQLVLISKQPSACPLVWPSLLSANELLMSSNEEQRAGWRPGQSSLIAFDPLLLPRVQLLLNFIPMASGISQVLCEYYPTMPSLQEHLAASCSKGRGCFWAHKWRNWVKAGPVAACPYPSRMSVPFCCTT